MRLPRHPGGGKFFKPGKSPIACPNDNATFGCNTVKENPRPTLIMTVFLAIWICLVPLFATADNCTDAFERISGLHPGTAVEIECSTERESVYKGTMRANMFTVYVHWCWTMNADVIVLSNLSTLYYIL